MYRQLFLRTKSPARATLRLNGTRKFSSGNKSSAGTGPANEEGKTFSNLAREWQFPASVGFLVIGWIQYRHLSNPTDEDILHHPAVALSRLPDERTEVEKGMATERQLQAVHMFPYRVASRIWGMVHDIPLPVWARKPLYEAWTFVFDCNLDEMKYPIESYKNLGEFFSRPLKDGARVIHRDPFSLTSPVDGRVAAFGRVESKDSVPLLEQVKGARYRMDDFLGTLPPFLASSESDKQESEGKNLFNIVIYLAPGDYHRIHAPADWSVVERRHFPGHLYPVNSPAAHFIPSLFAVNERVIMLGSWKYGFFSLGAVGATNVGSIEIDLEPNFRTNLSGQGSYIGKCFERVYETANLVTRGDQMAQFKLGSTVVLVFEAPKDFTFSKKVGDKVQLGEVLGSLGKASRAKEAQDMDNTTTFPSAKQLLMISRVVTGGGQSKRTNVVQRANGSDEQLASQDLNEQEENGLLKDISSSITSFIKEVSKRENVDDSDYHKDGNGKENSSSVTGLGPAYAFPSTRKKD